MTVRGARDRPWRYSLPRQRAGRLHQLFDRAQCRRQRLYRRRGALPDLFGVGTECDRCRQDLLSGRPDILARQCRGAWPGHRLSSGSGLIDRSASALAQSHGRVCDHRGAGGLCGLGLDPAEAGRPRSLDGAAARRSADAAADHDRNCRSRLLRAGDVRAGAGRTQSRFCRGRGYFCLGDAAGICQPFSRRARRIRRRHAGRAVADGPGRPAGGDAAVSHAVLYCAVRHICNLADASGSYPRRAAKAPANQPAGSSAEPKRDAAYAQERSDTGA